MTFIKIIRESHELLNFTDVYVIDLKISLFNQISRTQLDVDIHNNGLIPLTTIQPNLLIFILDIIFF